MNASWYRMLPSRQVKGENASALHDPAGLARTLPFGHRFPLSDCCPERQRREGLPAPLRGTTLIRVFGDDRTIRVGTGSLIDISRKLVLTNYHVAGDERRIMVVFPRFRNGHLIAESGEYADRTAGIPRGRHSDQRRDLVFSSSNRARRSPGMRKLFISRTSPNPGQRVHSIGNPGRSGVSGFIPPAPFARFTKRDGWWPMATGRHASSSPGWWRPSRPRTRATAADRSSTI